MKVLFIISALDSGGVAKSLVNLLNVIDRENRDFHLLMMSEKEGPFCKYLPQFVTIHTLPKASWLLQGWKGLKQLITTGHILLAFGSALRMFVSRFNKPYAGWLLARLSPSLAGEWDVIVDYNGQQDLYYMVDKLKGRKKITFFHNDYQMWPYYELMDRKYFPLVDSICTVSQKCVKSLQNVFPEVSEKVILVPNISSPDMILRLSDENTNMPDLHGHIFVTVGHVCYNKGIDLIVEASNYLKQEGIDFSWVLVGTTDGVEDYLKLIQKLRLENNVYFVGVQSNPYPFMKRADIIVHPSRFEGKSIALDEAKTLCKPIVVTNFSTVRDQFEDRVNATICEITSLSLASAIIELIKSPELKNKYIQSLKSHSIDNTFEVNAIYNRLFQLS